MTKAEATDLAIAHAAACADMSAALVEQVRDLKVEAALQSLVHIRNRHDKIAALLAELMPPLVRERKNEAAKKQCSSPTSKG
jgi:hypothetical protein